MMHSKVIERLVITADLLSTFHSHPQRSANYSIDSSAAIIDILW